MPLLTHDETGAESVARVAAGARAESYSGAGAVALAESPTTRNPAVRDGAPPRPKAAKKKRPPSPWRTVRRALLIVLGVAVLGPVLAFVVGWFLFKVPTADDATIKQVATFTFADTTDVPLATVRPTNDDDQVENRVKVRLDQIPPHVRNAVLAAENRTFYSDPGFDLTGIVRAVYNQLTGGVGGGSTITQQYVKVTTGDDDVSLLRKYKEIVIAVKISREQSKDEILENYLNTIYFGRGAYGIQTAAKAYFDKDVADLTVSEGAMIAGLIQSPSRWDPAKSLPDTQRRWTFVLDQMSEAAWVTPTERGLQVFPDNWLREAPTIAGVPDDDRYHIYELAQQELAAQGITQEQIDTGGLTVTTTVRADRQKEAVDAIKRVMEGQPGNLRSALVSIDPRTGAILAYYGGSNGVGNDYAQALRQPGSTYKPFVFAAALQGDKGVGLGSTFDGRSGQEFPGREGVVNNAGESSDCGPKCNVRTAMTNSVNTVFYRMGLDAGVQNVIDAAHQAGIPENLAGAPQAGISLGDQEVHPIDMATAYATLAADGQRHAPYIVAKVVAADGQVLFERDAPTAVEAFPQQVARNVTEAMLDVPAHGKFTLAGGRVAAAKTGTTQGDGDSNKDAWTVGYTPSIATAVWVGSDKSDPLIDKRGRAVFGASLPGPIWKAYMDAALKGTPKEQFSKFDPLGKELGSSNEDAQDSDNGNQNRNNNNNGDSNSRIQDRLDQLLPNRNNGADNNGGGDNGGNGGADNNGGAGGADNNGGAGGADNNGGNGGADNNGGAGTGADAPVDGGAADRVVVPARFPPLPGPGDPTT